MWKVEYLPCLRQEGAMCGYHAVFNSLCLKSGDTDALLQDAVFTPYYNYMKERVNHPDLAIDEVCLLLTDFEDKGEGILVPPILLDNFLDKDLNGEFLEALTNTSSRRGVVAVFNTGGHWLAGRLSLSERRIILVDTMGQSGFGERLMSIVSYL